MNKLLIRRFVLGLISLLIAGCAGSKQAVLPQDGPTMATIYRSHLQQMNTVESDVVRAKLNCRPIQPDERDLYGYTRDAFNEIDILFPRLPNPTLVMYVFPHLAGESRAPVPGYATAFSLYEQVEYALPGEVPTKTIWGRP